MRWIIVVIVEILVLSFFSPNVLFGQGEDLPVKLGCHKDDIALQAELRKKHALPSAFIDRKSGLLHWDSTLRAAQGKWIWRAELIRRACPGRPKFLDYKIMDQFLVKVSK